MIMIHLLPQAANYEFTTLTCMPGIVRYRGAKLQFLDLPGIIEGAKDGKGRGRQVGIGKGGRVWTKGGDWKRCGRMQTKGGDWKRCGRMQATSGREGLSPFHSFRIHPPCIHMHLAAGHLHCPDL